jgi:hypothetical protein
MKPDTHPTLSLEQIEALGDELDELRGRLIADLGERDADYIRKVIKAQRALEIGGRTLLFAGWLPPAWLGGTTALALSKILDNMKIGHTVMDGQYDLDEGPGAGLHGIRVGHRLPRRPVAALAQLHAPHLHQHPRQGPRHRLRRAADG